MNLASEYARLQALKTGSTAQNNTQNTQTAGSVSLPAAGAAGGSGGGLILQIYNNLQADIGYDKFKTRVSGSQFTVEKLQDMRPDVFFSEIRQIKNKMEEKENKLQELEKQIRTAPENWAKIQPTGEIAEYMAMFKATSTAYIPELQTQYQKMYQEYEELLAEYNGRVAAYDQLKGSYRNTETIQKDIIQAENVTKKELEKDLEEFRKYASIVESGKTTGFTPSMIPFGLDASEYWNGYMQQEQAYRQDAMQRYNAYKNKHGSIAALEEKIAAIDKDVAALNKELAWSQYENSNKWYQKYQGKTYGEISDVLQNDTTLSDDERQWMQAYGGSIKTGADYDNEISETTNKIAQLEAQRSQAEAEDLEIQKCIDAKAGLAVEVDSQTIPYPEGSLRWYNEYQRRAEQARQELVAKYDAYAAKYGGLTYGVAVDALDSEISAAKEKLEQLQYEKDYVITYGGLLENDDFEQMSQYVENPTDGKRSAMDIGSEVYSDEDSGWDYLLYEAINGNKEAESYLVEQAAARAGGNRTDGALAAILGRITDSKSEMKQIDKDEIAIFNYLYRTQGRAAAQKYYDYLQPGLLAEQRAEEEKAAAAYAQKHPVLSSISTVVTSPAKLLSYVGQVADYVGDGEIDKNAGYNRFVYESNAARKAVSEKVSNGSWGEVGSFLYNTGMSMGDFLLSTAVTGGNSALSLAIMGTGAAADTTLDALDRGLSSNQAMLLGTIAGATEVVTEKISIDALLNKTGMGRTALGYILQNALAEGSEEGVSGIANTLADILISKDKSQWQQSIQAYRDAGDDEKTAFWKAIGDQAAQIGLDVLGGALSGSAMGTGSAAISAGGAAITGNKLNKAGITAANASELIDAGMKGEKNGRAYYLATEMQAKLDAGEELTRYDLGRMYQANRAENLQMELTPGLDIENTAPEGGDVQLKDLQVNATPEMMNQAKRLSAVTGRKIVLYTQAATNKGIEDGYHENGVLYINTESPNPLAVNVGHELTHSIENTAEWGSLKDLVLNQIQKSGGNLEQQRQAKRDLYAKNGKKLADPDKVDREIVASYVASHLLSDVQSIENVVQQNPSLGQKIHNWLDSLLAKLGNQNAQEAVFLREARDLWASAIKKTQSSFTAETARATPAVAQKGQNTQSTADVMDMDLEQARAWAYENYSKGNIGEETLNQILNDIEAQEDEAEISISPEVELHRLGMTEGQYSISETKKSNIEKEKKKKYNKRSIYDEHETLFMIWANGSGKPGEVRKFLRSKKIRFYEKTENGCVELSKRQYDERMNFNGENTYRRAERGISEVVDSDGSTQGGQLDNFVGDRNAGGTAEISRQVVGEKLRNDAARGLPSSRGIPVESENTTESGGTKQYSISEPTVNKADVISSLRSILDKGGDPAALRQYVATLEQNTGKTEHNNANAYHNNNFAEYNNSFVYQTADTAEQIVKAAHGQGVSVEEYLEMNWERFDVDGQWNEDARQALELEESAGRQYSISNPGTFADFSDAQYSVLLRKRPITLSKKSWSKVNQARIQRYASMEESDIPEIDIFYIAEYNKINTAFAYVIRNYTKDSFVALTKKQIKPNVQEITDREERSYGRKSENVRVSSSAVSNGRDEGSSFVLADSFGFRGQLRENDSGITTKRESKQNLDNRDGVADSGARGSVERQYSISENDGAEDTTTEPAVEEKAEGLSLPTLEETDAGTDADVRSKLPRKAQRYLKGAERTLLNNLCKSLNVPWFARRSYLQPMVEEISNEYLRSGTVSQETIDRLFETAYEEGVVVDREFYDQYVDLKKFMQKNPVTLHESNRADIADFGDFKKRNRWNVRIVDEGGLPVDSAYRELREMAPELFPEDITHPADQLVRMADVSSSIRIAEKSLEEYYKHDPDFRKWAKNDFAVAVNQITGELRKVKRYQDDRMAEESLPAPETAEEAMEVYRKLKDARRTYEKALAKNLLTKQDEQQLGRLIRGEIELEHLKPGTDNVSGITAVYEAKVGYADLLQQIINYKKKLNANRRKTADTFLQDTHKWKDKKSGLAYSRETMVRNIEDIVPDKALAKKINAAYFEKVAVSEAEATRMKNVYRHKVEELDLSRKIAEGNLVSEAHAVQLLGEAQDNIRILEKSRGRIRERDGKKLSEWQAAVDNLWLENPQLDKAKIQHAVQEFRKLYDELFRKMNEVRVRNGYEPINYRSGYFPHFQPGDGDGVLGRFGKALGINTQVEALPTTINGLTHTFKPGIRWFGNAMERIGFNTAYDAVEGFDKYIEGAASVICQTDNIQNLRAFATQIRYQASKPGIQERVDEIRADTRLSEEEKETQINELYEKGGYALSKFVTEVDEYTNLLANKNSRLDRTWEAFLGREFYTLMKKLESQVGANMVGGNLSSAITNFIPLVQAGAQMDRFTLLEGMWATLKAYKTGDGLVEMSDFLTNRRGSDPLIRTWTQKVGNIAGKPMEFIDCFVADSIVRGAYYQNLKRGMTEEDAMHQADLFAARVMADRSKGAMPTLFSSSNPLIKVFTQFQLEVNNQFSEVFKDLPRGYREKGMAALVAVLLKYFFGAWLFNELYEAVVGRRPALDPIGLLNETVGDYTGYELPNLFGMGVDLIAGKEINFKTEQKSFGDATSSVFSSALVELPFSSGLTLLGVETDGGRIPISSAIPDLSALWDAATNTEWGSEKRWKEAGDELAKLLYVALPFGGNQLMKTAKGIAAAVAGGSYSVDSQGDEVLQYPVYRDVGSIIRATIMGKSSLKEAQDWVDSGFDSLNAKQTAAYQDMIAAGVDPRDAFSLMKELKALEPLPGEKSVSDTQKRQVILDSGISAEGKEIMVGFMLGTELTNEAGNPTQYAKFLTALDTGMDVDEYLQFRNDKGDVDKYLDLHSAGMTTDEAVKYTVALEQLEPLEGKKQVTDAQRRELLMKSDISEKGKTAAVGEMLGMEMETETGKPSQYAKFLSAMETSMTVDEYLQFRNNDGDIDKYLKLTDAGVSEDQAMELAVELEELEPLQGKDKVSDVQKWQTAVDSSTNAQQQLAALSGVMRESQYKKAEMAYTYGIKPQTFVHLAAIKPDFDADENGSYTQKEIQAAIDALNIGYDNPLLALKGEAVTLTIQQKAVLWQILTGAKKAKNNPYSVAYGQMVVDAKAE